MMIGTLRKAKRLVVAIIGFTVLTVGIALIVLPGPAFVVIPLGLAILGSEFLWAKRFMVLVNKRIERMRRGNRF